MLMPAMMLTTACSNDDDVVNNAVNTENTINKGYALPVTVNVTRQDGATRASFDGSKLNFSDGDKLFVFSYDGGSAGIYAGVLDWVSDGTFSGTIYTQNDYTGTIDALLSGGDPAAAVLLPAGYGDYGYLSTEGNSGSYKDGFTENYTKAFVASTTEKTAKALAVEQFSFENANYSGGFALVPKNAILSFTITGLTASTNVTATIKKGEDVLVSGSVTTDGSGNATFAMGIESAAEINPLTLTVGGKEITITSTNTVFDAGKIYNVTRNAIPGALVGKFSVSSTDKVYFSKGNLQYTKSTSEWSFMDHQYSTVETTSQAIGDNYASQDVVSLFGWGTSGWNNGNTYYQPYNTANTTSSYGPKNGTTRTYDLTGDYANADWGRNNAISNGGNTANTWRTLTKDEWTYLFNTRSASTVNGTANARYAKAYLFGTTHGVIIFPDVYTHPAGVTAPTGINVESSTSWNGNRYTATDWAKMEAAGCVFLPAAGRRDGTNIYNVNEYVRYWTSSYYSAQTAYHVGIESSNMKPADYNQKYFGYSVRLVRDAN
jgi:hypothetical protein